MESERAAEWISASRLPPFLKAANEDLDAALDLYHWHARVGAACFLTMHHLEVLVRNAIDGELGKEHPDEPLTQTWLMDFDVLRPDAVKQVIVAVERLEKGKAITRGRVIAALSSGSGPACSAAAMKSSGATGCATPSRTPRSVRTFPLGWSRYAGFAIASRITTRSSTSRSNSVTHRCSSSRRSWTRSPANGSRPRPICSDC